MPKAADTLTMSQKLEAGNLVTRIVLAAQKEIAGKAVTQRAVP